MTATLIDGKAIAAKMRAQTLIERLALIKVQAFAFQIGRA
jgi:hypothetical protein